MIDTIRFVPLTDDTNTIDRRERLHMVEDGFQHGFRVYLHWKYIDQFDDVLQWCTERYGPVHRPLSHNSWFVHDSTIWFVHEDQALEFKLRWV